MDNLKSSLFVIGNLLVFFYIFSYSGLYDYYLNGSDWVVFCNIDCVFVYRVEYLFYF